MYAKLLTKADLLNSGITKITEDGHVFKGDKEVTYTHNGKQGYICINIYYFDEEGLPKKRYLWRQIKDRLVYTYVYKTRLISLSRVMWAWFYNEAPEGWIVDHKNNQHTNFEDYNLNNLQLLTPSENITKERSNSNIREMSCNLSKPREFYSTRLNIYTEWYNQAKREHNRVMAHKYRTYMSNYCAKLRYFDSHIDEYSEKVRTNNILKDKRAKKKQVVQMKREIHAFAVSEKEKNNLDTWHRLVNFIRNYKDSDYEILIELYKKIKN